ncbi:Protein of unknown function [Cotesia congregata]|uniref:Uncharacterized protein n=1 Tax=Cotesia congregata TaxID=51543 RepID=A0A8J2H8Y8_COTCN|nr:Protein of unknown function [Cotesia congregata]
MVRLSITRDRLLCGRQKRCEYINRVIAILPLIIFAFIMKLKADSVPTINGLPPLKLDKNLRRALLRALEDLEAESAEDRSDPPTAEQLVLKIQEQESEEEKTNKDEENKKQEDEELDNKNREKILERFKGASVTYEHFASDSEDISEDKLQNSTFIETDKYQADAQSSEVKAEKSQELNQKLDVLLGDQAVVEKSPEPLQVEQVETRSVKSIGHSSNRIQNSFKPIAKDINHHNHDNDNKEILAISSSNGIASASANSLVPPSPTVSSPTTRPAKNASAPVLPTVPADTKGKNEEKSEVKIFQAPLVAAFTVQQDELGVPKSSFQTNFPDQLRIQQLPLHNDLKQNFNYNQNFNNLNSNLPQQSFLRGQDQRGVNVQSFPSVSVDFQPPAVPSSNRFNRQEALGSVGNFGINENRQQTRNHLVFDLPRPVSSFVPFNQFSSFRQPVHRPPTPARQIQQLLFQSGVAGELGRNHGAPGNHEDLSIVSKVLALNVGAGPNKSLKFNDDFFRA